MNIDLAEVFHHDCKSIVDQMKEKRLISYLDDFKFLLNRDCNVLWQILSFFTDFGLIMLKFKLEFVPI